METAAPITLWSNLTNIYVEYLLWFHISHQNTEKKETEMLLMYLC